MPSATARHLTLLVPGVCDPLPCPEESGPPVLEALTASLHLEPVELLLTRGDRVEPVPGDGSVEGLLWGCFDVPQPQHAQWPVAAVTYLADGGDPRNRWMMRADPVHLRPDLGELLLFDASTLGITTAEAQSLAAALNAHFEHEPWHIEALHPGRWYVSLEQAPSMCTRSTGSVLGGAISRTLPWGEEAARWRAAMNEAQMVLHAAAVNATREARGRPAINSVWFWGGGRLPAAPSARWDAVWADDPLAQGLSRLTSVPCSPLTEDARQWLQAAQMSGRHLLVLDSAVAMSRLADVDAWRQFVSDLNRAWIAPLLAAVDRGELTSLGVVPGPDTVLRATRSSLRRWWRRRRRWSDLLAERSARKSVIQ